MQTLQSLPSADGIAESIVEAMFGAVLESIDSFATDFLKWLGGVRDPTENDLLVDAWFAVFEISLAVLVIWVVLGLLSFPFGDDQKTDLYRFGWRIIGVFIIFAIAQPAFSFGAELSNELFQMIFTLTEEGADIEAEFNGLVDTITSAGGTAIGLLVAGVITAVMMGVAQLIIVAVMFSIDYIFWTAFVFSPLLAVFWMVDWGPLAKANDFAETMFDAAVGSLLYPVAISVFATAYVVLVGAGVQGGLNDSTLSAMLELTAMSVIFPFIILAVGFKLLSQVGNGMYGLSTVGKIAGVAVTAGAGAVVGGIQGAATAAGSGGSSALSGAASGMASGAQRGAQTIARGGMGPTNEPMSSVGMGAASGGGSGQTSRGGASNANDTASGQNTTTNASSTTGGDGGQSTTTASNEPQRGGLIGQATGAVAAHTPESIKSAGSTITGAAGRVSPRPSTQYNRQKAMQEESLESTANYQETADELEQAGEGDSVDLDSLKEQGIFEETEASAPSDGQGEVTVDENGRVQYQSEEGGRDMVDTDDLATASNVKASKQLRKAERAENRAGVANKGKQAASGVASGMQFTGAMAGGIGMMGARDVVMGHPGYTNFSMGSSASSGSQTSGSGAAGAEATTESTSTERAVTSVSPAYFGADDDDRAEANASSYQTLSNGERVDLESDEGDNLSVVRDPERSSESELAEVGWAMSRSQAEAAPDDPGEMLDYYRQEGTRLARSGDNAPKIPTEGSVPGYANTDVAEVDGEETVMLDGSSGELAESEVRPAEFDGVDADESVAVRGEYQEQPGGGAYIQGVNGTKTNLQQRIDSVESGEQTLVEGGVRELDDGSKTLDSEYQPSTETSDQEAAVDGEKQKQKQQRQPNTPSGGIVPLGKQGIALPDDEKSEIAGNSTDYVGSVDDSLASPSVGGVKVADNTSDGRFSDDDGRVDIGRDGENVSIRNADLDEVPGGYFQMKLSDDTVVENPRDLSSEAVEEYGENEAVEELRWGDEATGTERISISETPPVNTLSESERAIFDGESVDIDGEVEKPEFGRRTIGGISIQDESTDGRFSEDGTLKQLPSAEEGDMVQIENAQYRVIDGKGGTEVEEAVLTDQSRVEIQDTSDSDSIEPSIRRGEATSSNLAVDKASVKGGSINTEEMDYVNSSRELNGMAVSATGVVDQRPSGETVLRGQGTDNESISLTDETRGDDGNRAQVGDGALTDVEPGDTVSLNQSVVDSDGEQLRLTENTNVEAVETGSDGVPTLTIEKDYSKDRLTDDRSGVRPVDAETLAETNLETAFDGGEEVSMQEVTFVESEISGEGPVEKGGQFVTPDGKEIGSYSQLETEGEPDGDRLQDGGTYDVNALAVDDEGRFKPSVNTELSRLDTDGTTTEQQPDRQVDIPDDSSRPSSGDSTMRNSGGDTTPNSTQSTTPEPGRSSKSGEDGSEKDKSRSRSRSRDRGGIDNFTPTGVEYNDENDESEDN